MHWLQYQKVQVRIIFLKIYVHQLILNTMTLAPIAREKSPISIGPIPRDPQSIQNQGPKPKPCPTLGFIYFVFSFCSHGIWNWVLYMEMIRIQMFLYVKYIIMFVLFHFLVENITMFVKTIIFTLKKKTTIFT